MNRNVIKVVIIFLFCVSAPANAQQTTPQPQPVSLPGADSRIYKTIGSTDLLLHIFKPAGRKAGERLPAIIFFFGGGWTSGSITQFVPHATYLAERGMVAIVADYRVKSRHGVTPFECVADAKSAIRWLRTNALELGIDPNRIAAAGSGAAGGHLAAGTALLDALDEKNENLKISSVPNALVLFNPALDLLPLGERSPALAAVLLGDRSKRAAEISPSQHVRKQAPPTIIFHGTADATVPFEQAARFCEAMKMHGNRCEVVSFEGRDHGFFNYGRGDNSDYRATLSKTDEFLVSLKYLKAVPKK